MPQVSRKRLPPKILKSLFDSLSFVFKDLANKEEMDEFLDSLLTKTEKLMLAKRMAVAYLLQKGIEEKQISNTIAVTPATVSRMKLWAQTHPQGFKMLFTKLEKEKRLKITKQLLLQLLSYTIRSAGGRIKLS